MVLDFHKLSRKATDRIFDYFDLFTDGKYPPRFKKFLEWYGYKFQPVLLSFASTIIMFIIFFRIYDRVGFEKVIIILLILVIISIRSLKK